MLRMIEFVYRVRNANNSVMTAVFSSSSIYTNILQRRKMISDEINWNSRFSQQKYEYIHNKQVEAPKLQRIVSSDPAIVLGTKL